MPSVALHIHASFIAEQGFSHISRVVKIFVVFYPNDGKPHIRGILISKFVLPKIAKCPEVGNVYVTKWGTGKQKQQVPSVLLKIYTGKRSVVALECVPFNFILVSRQNRNRGQQSDC